MKKPEYNNSDLKVVLMKVLGITMSVLLILVNVANATQVSDAWGQEGNTLTQSGNYDEAIKAYDKAIENNPLDSVSWYNKGNALRHLEKYNEAMQAYETAIEINPQYSEAWNNKGAILEFSHKYGEALVAYTKAIDFDPYNSKAAKNKERVLYILNDANYNNHKDINNNNKPQQESSFWDKVGVGIIAGYIVKNIPTVVKAIPK